MAWNHPEDTQGDQDSPLAMHETVTVAGMKPDNTAKLAERIELAVGMRAMIIINIATEANLANGTRGEIIDIKLDPREPSEPMEDEGTGARLLSYPPVLVLFKPDHCTMPAFEVLPQGVLPVVPFLGKFTIRDRHNKPQRISRRQLAITPAYAFTDYKSQGQTMGHRLRRTVAEQRQIHD
ncbi:hypothetical protein B0H16DRAFT_1719836 [Mycena metata]|uniref:Uncharacterized protein n=1 Tax=Mycena metata TaxID=1033252 RepID=A0AAD7JDC7_9AGAR|nr:hypothetical protein B0H16DRAFT_1719836 [Mycena metata]